MVLKWNKIKGADTYKIYGAKCGSSYKLLKTVSSKKLTWTNRKLKKGTHYKYYIVAISNGQKLATSPRTHAVTKGSRYGYAQKITVNKTALKLRTGKTKRIKASVTNSSTYIQETCCNCSLSLIKPFYCNSFQNWCQSRVKRRVIVPFTATPPMGFSRK